MSAHERDAARQRLNEGVQAWTDRWRVVNGLLICVKCGTRQRPSEANVPFAHSITCALRDDLAYRQPWLELADLLLDLPAGAGA